MPDPLDRLRDRVAGATGAMTDDRRKELIQRYAYPTASLADAERAASGYALTLDESQLVDDTTLSADIDEMREALGVR